MPEASGGDIHLEFGVKDLHIKTVLLNLLHANALGLRFIPLLLPQCMDLVALGQPLDELRLQLSGVGILHVMVARRSHAPDGAPLESVGRAHEAAPFLHSSRILRVHHQPLVVLLAVVLLELLCRLPVDVVSHNRADIRSSVSFHDDEVARLDRQTRAFLDVEYIGARAFEVHDVEKLVVAWL